MSINRVILIGNVGKDPEVKHLDSGVSVARFSLATNENFTDKSGKKTTQTEWHNIVVWRGAADIVEKYVKSGMMLYIEGKIKSSTYEDKEHNKQHRTDIICETFRFLGSPQKKEAAQEPTDNAQIPSSEPTDDLPF